MGAKVGETCRKHGTSDAEVLQVEEPVLGHVDFASVAASPASGRERQAQAHVRRPSTYARSSYVQFEIRCCEVAKLPLPLAAPADPVAPARRHAPNGAALGLLPTNCAD